MKLNVFIISYNRLSFLKQQVEFLSRNPMLKLHIVDNGSTYPPLLEYLFKSHHYVYSMPDNHGHQVIWKTNFSSTMSPNDPYLVTDNDVIPENINFHELLLEGLDKFPSVNKIGLGLRTDDIPMDAPFRNEIIKHENEVLKRENSGDSRFIRMPVDTTIAIYRAGYHNASPWGSNDRKNCCALRTTGSLAKHLSWYITEEEMKSEENKFYFESLKSGSTHWSVLQAGYGKTKFNRRR